MAWAAQVRSSQLDSLASLRLLATLQAAMDGESIWLRGKLIDEATLGELWMIPDVNFFQLREHNALIPMGGVVSTATLPELEWKTLSEFIELSEQ